MTIFTIHYYVVSVCTRTRSVITIVYKKYMFLRDKSLIDKGRDGPLKIYDKYVKKLSITV